MNPIETSAERRSAAVRAAMCDEIADALQALWQRSRPSDEAMHRVRKDLKRARAALRLLREVVGEAAYAARTSSCAMPRVRSRACATPPWRSKSCAGCSKARRSRRGVRGCSSCGACSTRSARARARRCAQPQARRHRALTAGRRRGARNTAPSAGGHAGAARGPRARHRKGRKALKQGARRGHGVAARISASR